MRARFIALLAMPLLWGCIDAVDGAWFNPQALDAYEWPHNEVPPTHLEVVELAGTAVGEEEAAPTIYGVWAKQCLAPGDCLPANYPERQQTAVLYFHGNAKHLPRYWDRVQILWRLGYTVFAIDYRGYGRSTGEPSEEGIYADGRTALAEVRRRAAELGISSVVYYGFSLGSTVAVQLSVEEPAPALILEAPLASGQAFVDDAAALGLDASVLMDTQFNNLGKIPYVLSPKLIVHGTEDDFVRYKFGRRLFEAAQEPKELRPVEGAEHGNVPCPSKNPDVLPEEDPCLASSEYRQWITEFVDRWVAP